MIDAVLSYHTNGATCGVAKFNQRLARELGVPCYSVRDGRTRGHTRHLLLSIKPEEIPETVHLELDTYDLFLHGPDDGRWTKHAAAVYAANAAIADRLKGVRPDVIEAWCPSTIEGNPHRGAINVLTFGMANKIQTARYDKLKALLDATGEDYTVSVSTAIHEGSPWDETALVGERLRGVFGSALRVLGYLADDALAKELQEATAVALFFEPALRANNTTFWAALDAGCPVVTNVDAYSPAIAQQVGNIDTMTHWSQVTAAKIRAYDSWPTLIETIRAQVPA